MSSQHEVLPRDICVIDPQDALQEHVILMFKKQKSLDSSFAIQSGSSMEHEDVTAVLEMIENGEIRAAWHEGSTQDGVTYTNPAVMAAINLLFPLSGMETMQVGPFEFHDKVPLRTGFAEAGVRVVPPATVRSYAYLESGVVAMPSYTNLGAYVGAGTMIDTWATVGSCAQIGRYVHLSGGVGVGGVLEPAGAVPVIILDGAFIGSRCQVVDGALIGESAVMAMNTSFSGATPVIDVDGETMLTPGVIPDRAVVVPDYYHSFILNDDGTPNLAASLNSRGEISSRYRVRIVRYLPEGQAHDKTALNELLRGSGIVG